MYIESNLESMPKSFKWHAPITDHGIYPVQAEMPFIAIRVALSVMTDRASSLHHTSDGSGRGIFFQRIDYLKEEQKKMFPGISLKATTWEQFHIIKI